MDSGKVNVPWQWGQSTVQLKIQNPTGADNLQQKFSSIKLLAYYEGDFENSNQKRGFVLKVLITLL